VPVRPAGGAGPVPGRPAYAIIACDFLVVETVLLQRLYVLVFIEHGTRRLHVAGVRAAQQARLTPAQTT